MANNIMLPQTPDAGPAPAGRPDEGLPLGQILARYWVLFKRYFWVLLLTCVLGVTAAHFYAQRQPRVYQTKAKIIFHQAPQNIFGKNIERLDLFSPEQSWQFRQFWNTQKQVLKSRSFVQKVVTRVGLLERSDLIPTKRADGTELTEAQRTERAINRILSSVTVSMERNSRVATISVTGTDPAFVQTLATEYVLTYINYAREFQSGGLNQMISWFDDYVSTKRAELTKAQQKLHKFKYDRKILSISHESRQNLTASAMEAVGQKYNEVQAKLASERALLGQIEAMRKSGDDLRGISELIERPSLRAALEREALLEERLAKLRGLEYGDKWREVKAARGELKSVREHNKEEVGRLTSGLNNRIGRHNRERSRLKRELDRLQQEALDLDALGLEYNELKDNTDSLRQLYESVLKRSEELDINSMYDSNSVEVLEEARKPRSPISPNVPVFLLLGLALGLGLGIGVIVLIDLLDATIKGQDDVMRVTDRPILGVLPRVEPAMLKSLEEIGGVNTLDQITHLAPRSSFAEGIKGLRTNLMFMSPDNPPRVLLVTSPGPGEGKTLVVSNMAIAMAQSGLKTIVIDGDMRRPRLHKAFAMERGTGITDILLENKTLDDVVIGTDVENLFVLRCGDTPPNPSELLYTERFAELIDELRQTYDRVIFDSPPLGAVTDAAVLSHKVDSVIMLLMFGKTRRDTMRRSIEQLTTVGAPFTGCIMNNLSANAAGYGYSYYYYRSPYLEDEPPKKPTKLAG